MMKKLIVSFRKSSYVLFYLKSTGTVYVTSIKTLTKHFPQLGGHSGNSLSRSLKQTDLEKKIVALNKESDTATVYSACWKGDPAKSLFQGKSLLSGGKICPSGCGLTLRF